jgi:hypothetical protein
MSKINIHLKTCEVISVTVTPKFMTGCLKGCHCASCRKFHGSFCFNYVSDASALKEITFLYTLSIGLLTAIYIAQRYGVTLFTNFLLFLYWLAE